MSLASLSLRAPRAGSSAAGVRSVAVGAVLVAALLGAALALGPVIAAGALVFVLGSVAAAVMPRYWLWPAVLCVSALVPIGNLPVPHILYVLNPAMFVVAVLALRTIFGGRSTPFWVGPQVWLLLSFTAWLLITVVFSIQRGTAIGWMLTFLVLVVLLALVGFGDQRAGRAVEETWIVLGAVLGAYALVEAFVFHANPLFGGIFTSGPDALTQHYSIYRATTTLGHPVGNGLFFVVAVPLALGRMVSRDRVRWHLVATALAAGGVIASGTRTAFVAALISGAVVLFGPASAMMRQRGGVGIRLAVAIAMALTLVLGVWYLSARNSSAEGSSSASFRTTEIAVAKLGIAESPLVGVGPGVAAVRWKTDLTGTNGAGAFESMWLELVVGSGLPGLALSVAVFAAAIGTALRRRATPAAAAMIAFLVTASGFNVWEGGRPSQVRIGLLLVMCLAVARPGRASIAPDQASSTTAPVVAAGFPRPLAGVGS
jgi:polysaccharide biosynthesis protein PslJ